MSTTTESPFSLTIKVGPNNDLLTGRADTVEEMLVRVSELRRIEAGMQGVTQHVTSVPVTNEQAVQNLAQAGVTGTVIETSHAIDKRQDKWGNDFTKGFPDAGTCSHGTRIVKDWTDKSGKTRKAYVCINDSPFGDYKATKCDLVWPPR